MPRKKKEKEELLRQSKRCLHKLRKRVKTLRAHLYLIMRSLVSAMNPALTKKIKSAQPWAGRLDEDRRGATFFLPFA